MSTPLQQHIVELTQALTADNHDHAIVDRIERASRISPQLALDIYRNNTRGTRIKALEQIYPACHNILGNDTFHTIARGFVAADVEGMPDLNHYGERFGHYLGELIDAGRLPEEYVYLGDLAGLEYLFHAAYYADTDPVFDFELFEHSVNSSEPVYLKPSASLGLLATPYPVYDIWQLNRPAPQGRPVSAQQHDVEAINRMQYLLVYREQDSPIVVAIGERQYRLLDAFANGRSLQAVIDEIGRDVDVLLPRLIANRWIVGVG